MDPAEDYVQQGKDVVKRILNYIPNWINRHLPARYQNSFRRLTISIYGGIFLLLILLSVGISQFWRTKDIASSSSNPERDVVSPKNIDEAKVKKAFDDKCNTSNNFESSLWKTSSMRVVSRDEDTGEPLFLGAKQEEPYQSLMVYEIPCKLPIVATVSGTMRSPLSLGMVFEFDGVLQILVGDGDLRSIRYKTDTLGTRKEGWKYILEPGTTRPLTHWLPKGETIVVGSQISATYKLRGVANKIEVRVSLSYSPKRGEYKTQEFPWVLIDVPSYDTMQNMGRYIRVGMNDYQYKGTQSEMDPQYFSILSGDVSGQF